MARKAAEHQPPVVKNPEYWTYLRQNAEAVSEWPTWKHAEHRSKHDSPSVSRAERETSDSASPVDTRKS